MCQDQGIYFEFGDNKAIDQTTENAQQQPRCHANPQAFSQINNHRRGDTRTGNYGGDRKVKVTGSKAEQHATSHHPRHGNCQAQPFHINEGGKIWDKNGTGDKKHRKHHQHAVLIPDTPEAE